VRSPVASPCAVCGGDRRPALRMDAWRIDRCGTCGLHALSPQPDGVRMEEFDDGSAYDVAFALREPILAQHDRTLDAVERWVGPGRLLDVGSGPAFLLEAGRARGWDSVGVDPSSFAVEHARGLGFEAHEGMLEDLRLEEGGYDAVALLQVVEHLVDPRPLLAECRRLLRPGGALVVATPNPVSVLARVKRERFNYWIPPTHCVWYTPDALGRLLDAAGFASACRSTWSARAPGLHDGEDILASTRFGRRIPVRARRAAGDILVRATDAFGLGSIVEQIVLRREAECD